MSIRQRIKEKVESMKQDQEIPLASEHNSRTRKGLKYSTRASNPEGLLEKEIKLRELKESPVGKKYKPKHRAQLTSIDIAEIVQTCQVECKTH